MDIKSFGLEFHDLPTMISNVNYLLRLLTLNLDPRNNKTTGWLGWLWLVFIFTCYSYVYLVSMVWFVFWRCRETGEVVTAVIVFSLGISSGISSTKLLYVLFYRNELRKIVGEYLKFDSQVVPGTRFAVNLQPTLRAAKKRALIVWNVIFWNGLLYILIPLLRPGAHMPEDTFEFYGIKDMKSHPEHDIAFFINAFAGFVSFYPAANITAFFIIVTGYSEAQLLALSEELINVWSDALTKYSDIDSFNAGKSEVENDKKAKFIDSYINKKMKEFARNHIININLLKGIEGVFRGATAMEFILLTGGLIAQLLGGLENTYIQVPFTMMFVVIDCVTGQRIIDACQVLERAVYNSQWENFNVRNRKVILLILRNSQKTLTLSAGGLTVLSFETLMQVIKMIYSTYTTLRTTMN